MFHQWQFENIWSQSTPPSIAQNWTLLILLRTVICSRHLQLGRDSSDCSTFCDFTLVFRFSWWLFPQWEKLQMPLKVLVKFCAIWQYEYPTHMHSTQVQTEDISRISLKMQLFAQSHDTSCLQSFTICQSNQPPTCSLCEFLEIRTL